MMNRRTVLTGLIALAAAGAGSAAPGGWSDAVEVRHEDELCVSYQARLDGPLVLVRATLGSGWHTFAMDNELRAQEKLAGKPALSIDRSTEVKPAGLEIAGPWYQSPPKDFSHPELRWFSFGFDQQALFAARVRSAAAGTARLTVRGQACTDKICKNIDVAISLPAVNGSRSAEPAEINLKSLVPVR